MNEDIQSEELILNAARSVFIRKGFAASRMQEIADEAGINRALLHYYFRSKEKLFEKIFSEALEKIFPNIKAILDSDDSLFSKLERIVHHYISFATEHPYLPGFVIHELNQHPDEIPQLIRNSKQKPDFKKFAAQVFSETEAGNIIAIKPVHLLINTLSLCLFPFVAKPMLHAAIDMSDEAFNAFIQEREKVVCETIINSIKKR